MNNQHTIRALALICAGIVLASCQHTQEPDAVAQPLRSFSVVSTSARTFAPQPGARIAWRGELMVHAAEGTPRDPAALQFLREQIDSQLQAKGYQLVAPGMAADYNLQGLLVVGDEINERELGDVLGFNPGLVAEGTPYQTGSLVLVLLNARSQETEWRSAVEILSAPDLPEEARELRLKSGVANLLRPLPTLTSAP